MVIRLFNITENKFGGSLLIEYYYFRHNTYVVHLRQVHSFAYVIKQTTVTAQFILVWIVTYWSIQEEN
jgi:hypothetical protein